MITPPRSEPMKELPERVSLARRPTPIQPLVRTSADLPVQLWAWRDDLTGCVLSGNKIRKLEFLLAEAQQQGATAIVTCGGLQSNHVRATVFAARRLGLEVTTVLRLPPEGSEPKAALTGNFLLDRLAGAHVVEVPFVEYDRAGRVYDDFLARAAAELQAEGHVPYVVPEGGSNPLGALGYFAAVAEMLAEWRKVGPGTEAPDALFLALGSGGTQAGLVLGLEAHGLDPARVHAVNVCNDGAYFQKRVGELVRATVDRFGLFWQDAPLQIHDGHVGAGYGRATDDDLRFYVDFAATEGLLLDPCYTGKAMRAMLAEIAADPSPFGQHVLFLHSGGLFGSFAYADQYARALAAR
jgi:D-cysteine desulfhydrase